MSDAATPAPELPEMLEPYRLVALLMQGDLQDPREHVHTCFRPMPTLDHPLALQCKESLLWSLVPLCTPPAQLQTWSALFQQHSDSARASRFWESLESHVSELLGSSRLFNLRNKLDEVAESLLAWADEKESPGLGLVHILVFDRYIKVGKTTVHTQSKSMVREPSILARLRSYMVHARSYNATLTHAPIVLVATSAYKSDLVESFIHLHVRVYHSDICLDVSSSSKQSVGNETYSAQALSTVLNSVMFAATRTVQQLLSGKNSLAYWRNRQSRGLPVTKEEVNDSLSL
ncbi:CRY2 [Symbiodinium sp. CCMP2592]|nr:CRY2 [Symbiodinium sp. CCMP2592]